MLQVNEDGKLVEVTFAMTPKSEEIFNRGSSYEQNS